MHPNCPIEHPPPSPAKKKKRGWWGGGISKINLRLTRNETCTNLTMSSPTSGVMLMLLLLILRASDVDAPSDL